MRKAGFGERAAENSEVVPETFYVNFRSMQMDREARLELKDDYLKMTEAQAFVLWETFRELLGRSQEEEVGRKRLERHEP